MVTDKYSPWNKGLSTNLFMNAFHVYDLCDLTLIFLFFSINMILFSKAIVCAHASKYFKVAERKENLHSLYYH